LLQFLVYEPGTVIDEDIPNDEELGFPLVTYLQNAGDPDIVPAPGVITDFCSPLEVENNTLGVSTDNPETEADESGVVLGMNPTDGTYTFRSFGFGQFDADGDSYENGLDTCALEPNVGNPRVPLDGDLDSDGLDQACDPNDDAASGGTNSDEDLDGYLNRQDNCPLDPNGEAEGETNQADEDKDGIGDDCDPNPDTDDGPVLINLNSPSISVPAAASPASWQEACPDCWRAGDNTGDGNGGIPTEATTMAAPQRHLHHHRRIIAVATSVWLHVLRSRAAVAGQLATHSGGTQEGLSRPSSSCVWLVGLCCCSRRRQQRRVKWRRRSAPRCGRSAETAASGSACGSLNATCRATLAGNARFVRPGCGSSASPASAAPMNRRQSRISKPSRPCCQQLQQPPLHGEVKRSAGGHLPVTPRSLAPDLAPRSAAASCARLYAGSHSETGAASPQSLPTNRRSPPSPRMDSTSFPGGDG
jgi:hypothetical protein